jgi:hypothetical protein
MIKKWKAKKQLETIGFRVESIVGETWEYVSKLCGSLSEVAGKQI